MSKYVEGIIYDPFGKMIYKGIFIENSPKEGKNIKIYRLNEELDYDGDILNGQYNGHGTLYEKGKYEKRGKYSDFKYLRYIGDFTNDRYNGYGKLFVDNFSGKYLFYEGNFENGSFNGNGKIYYQNKQIFYDGQFKNNQKNGKGVEYYKNGNIKTEGDFVNNLCIGGIYYSPDGKKLYEGEFKNGIPKESEKIIIYENNCNKLYEGEIHDGNYEGLGIEYCPIIKDKITFKGNFKNNSYIIPNFEINPPKDGKNVISSKVILLSCGDVPGKTSLIHRLINNDFKFEMPSTVGADYVTMNFENNNTQYKLVIWDTAGVERFRSMSVKYAKNSNIAIYLFDYNDDKGINPKFLEEIKENNKDIKIYIVGNKIDLIDEYEKMNKEYYELLRNLYDESFNINLVDKYFEVSAATGEGKDKLLTSLKMDSLMFFKSKNENPDIKANESKKKEKEKCLIY